LPFSARGNAQQGGGGGVGFLNQPVRVGDKITQAFDELGQRFHAARRRAHHHNVMPGHVSSFVKGKRSVLPDALRRHAFS